MILFEGEAKVFSSSSEESTLEDGECGIGVHDGKVSGWIARLARVCSTRFVDKSGEVAIMRIWEISISVCKVSGRNT